MARNKSHRDRPIPVAWGASQVHYVGAVEVRRVEDGLGTEAVHTTLCGKDVPNEGDTSYGGYVKAGTRKCRKCTARYAQLLPGEYS